MDTIADYELVRSLGAGNHGEFFLARAPERLGSGEVAIKLLAGHSTADTQRRAIRELRAFAAVRSPYLVPIFEAGEEGGRFWYSTEYCPLGSLADPARPLTRREVLRAVAHASHAAHALHEAGIAHRGIKPSDVMLGVDGARLADLGLAQVLTPGVSITSLGPVGAVEYIDPDLLRGGEPSRATDIWSLGMTLHNSLAGNGLYGDLEGVDSLLVIRKVLAGVGPLDPSSTPEERAVIERCLQPDPRDRYPTAADLAQDLETLAARS